MVKEDIAKSNCLAMSISIHKIYDSLSEDQKKALDAEAAKTAKEI